MVKCPNCGAEILSGLSFCEECNKQLPQELINSNATTNSKLENSNMAKFSNSNGNFPNFTTQNQTVNYQEKKEIPKQNLIEVVQNKPKVLFLREIKSFFISWTIVIVGFATRRYLLEEEPDLFLDLFEATLLVILIFGFWIFIEKIASRRYRIYTEYLFDSNRALLSFI
ncbi:MAG: hypothetical protein ACFFD1_08870, partial [Candidatus Thorarchaeota archaeon]